MSSSPDRGQLSQPGGIAVGQPIYFSTGTYEGRTIRMELHEIQKADLGRKYARVDRRPLDPPPVVQLKMFEVHDVGTEIQAEKELDYDDVQVFGLLCTVDLFPVPGPDNLATQATPNHPIKARPASPSSSSGVQRPCSPSPSASSSTHSPPHYDQQLHEYQLNTVGPSSAARTSQNHFSGYILPTNAASDIVHRINGFPIKESSKETQALVGATFVQPVVMDYQGKKAVIFAFADLAVKIEGYFILRYRAFDIMSRPYSSSNELTISAECYGGIFRVYSTKEFPGLSASTELTKRLSLWGVRLNIRVTERKRRRRPTENGRRSPTPEYLIRFLFGSLH